LLESQVNAYLEQFQTKPLSKPSHCALCRQVGRLRYHGGYSRRLIALAKTYVLPVQRVFCALCRRTFALLPPFVVKFHRYAREVIQSAMVWLKTQTYEAVAESIASHCQEPKERNIAARTLYFWRRKFGLND